MEQKNDPNKHTQKKLKERLCINLGSGMDYRQSNKEKKWINIDKHPKVKADIHIDFIKKKLPFEDNSVDFAVCRNLLPHIKYRDMHKIIREVHRVLKKGGIFYVNAIHFSSRCAWEPAHTQAYNLRFFKEIFCDDIAIKDYYKFIQKRKIGKLFEVKSIKFKYINDEFIHLNTEKWGMKKRISNDIISFLANLNPNLCDRVWCHWVGGFDLIEGEFIKR